jgi:bacteriorhodopsin
MNVYIIWLIAVIAWNFGVPGATPIEDVMVAILLSYLSILLKKYLKH